MATAGAQAVTVTVRSMKNGANSPITAASTKGTSAQVTHTRPRTGRVATPPPPPLRPRARSARLTPSVAVTRLPTASTTPVDRRAGDP